MSSGDRRLEDFGNRLRKMARHRRRWPQRGIEAYRLYDNDVPGVRVAIDRYGEWIHVAEYARRGESSHAEEATRVETQNDGDDADSGEDGREPIAIDDVVARLVDVLEVPADRVVVKRRERQRGLEQYEKREASDTWIEVVEQGLRFRVNLTRYLDTGLFLDHRETRRQVREQAAGKRFLNLFAYTGSFTVYAADGGAASTTTVDLSNTYLDWARENLVLNGLDGPHHRGVRSGTMEFLTEHEPGAHYDLVVVDPPTFSRSKRTEDDWNVQRDHVALLAGIRRLLAPDFEVIFSTNFRRFQMDDEGIAALGFAAREITKQTVPEDFRGSKCHRAWRLTPASAPR